jgi:hypothetical protein
VKGLEDLLVIYLRDSKLGSVKSGQYASMYVMDVNSEVVRNEMETFKVK